MAVLSAAINEDAAVYVELLGITQTGVQAEARSWFFREFTADSYADLTDRYPEGGREHDLLYSLLSFYEGVGVLVSRGLLQEDLLFDAPLGFDRLWQRIGPALQEWRKETDPWRWENTIWLGKRYQDWRKRVWKPKLDAIPPDRPVRRKQS